MANLRLCCQVCQATFWKIGEIKSHMFSKMHKKKMEEIFQKDKFCGHGFPSIVMMCPFQKKEIKYPIIGLSLLTLCFSPDMPGSFFYLCHVCEEKCLPKNIVGHLNSGDHCSNYFTYMNPNVLSYSWIPSMSMRDILGHEILEEGGKAETRQLQMLDLPKELLKKLASCNYFKVIRSLRENDKLLKLFEAVELKRMMLQKYQKDTTRKHPLLGMQHIVECICVGPTERRHYLCTLCNLTFATHMVIKHVLSFDHIFGYFKAWHPSTLLSKESYTDHTAFASLILNFAKQTEEIHGAANTDLKQIQLEPAEYIAINFACYKEALKELEAIRKKKEESSLLTVIMPGQKLVKREPTGLPPSECGPVGQSGPKSPLLIRCQECKQNFDSIIQYVKHVRSWMHQQALKEYFGNKYPSFANGAFGKVPYLMSYSYLKECSKSETAVGVSLVVMCFSSESQDKPVCVCFACSECFLDSSAKTHFNSSKHIINTLLHLNPWRLPLGWDNFQDLAALESAAKEEERERGLNQTVLKALDIPPLMLKDLNPPSYSKVLTTLKQHYTLLKHEVPPSETRTKLKDKERFPLLGREFLVKFNVSDREGQRPEAALLCTLCQRIVSFKENYAHMFGREHIKQFISCFHPGSLKPNTDVETLLDFAKQALCHHPVLNIQEIELEKPIQFPCTYITALISLRNAKTRQGKGKLKPNITPKMQLFPRGSLKDTDKTPVKDPVNGCKVEISEKSSPKSTDFPVDMEVGAEVNVTQCAVNTEQKVDLKSLTPSEKDSVKTVKEEIKSAGERCDTIKKEAVEMPVLSEPSNVKTESCEYQQTGLSNEIGVQCVKNLTDIENFPCKEEKIETLISMSKESEDVRLCEQKRLITEAQSLPSSIQKEETEAEEKKNKAAEEGGITSQESARNEADFNVSMQKKHFKSDVSSGSPTSLHQHPDQLWQYIKRPHREPVIGLGALFECSCDQHNPIYLCVCCSEKILEKDIINHVSGVNHHKMYFLGFKPFPSLPGACQGMKIKHFATLYEKHYGYGEAQVIDVDEEVYHNVLSQNFESALETVKALQAQQDSVCERILSSVPSPVQPVETTLISETEHELSLVRDDFQVMDVEMEDGSKDSEENPSSLTSTKTPEVASDSSENVQVTLGKESHFARTTYCQTVVKSEEAASSCVFTRGTNTFIQLDSRQNNFKLEVNSDTAVRLKQEEENVALTLDADMSDTAVTTSTKTVTAVSKCTAKDRSCAPESFNKTAAPISKLSANISSCTAAKPGKCATSTSSASATTCKSSTANSSKSSTTTVSTGNANSGSATTKHLKEAVYRCATSTTTPTSANNNRVTTHKYVTSTTGASAATKPTEVNPASSTMTDTTTAATNSDSQPTTLSGISATTKSIKTTHKISTPITSHCEASKESTATNHSTVTSTNKFAAPTNSCNATKTNRETDDKCATSTMSANAAPTKPTSKTTSNLRHEQVSKPVTGKTGVTTKAGMKPGVVQEASYRHPPAAISQAVVSSVPAAEPSVRCGNTEATSKTAVEKKSVGFNADVAYDNSSTALKGALTIGLNYGIKVTCGNKKQIYCRLCSSRLRRAGHFSSFRHKSNYVKMKYPTWTAKPSEMKSKLEKIVAHLAEIEKDLETKGQEKFEVNLKTYKELGDPLLPEDKAFENLMEKMRQKDSGVSSSTADPAEVWTPDSAFPNSPEDFSPDDEINIWQNETAGSENQEVLQAPHAKISEGEAVSGDERPLAAGQLDTSEKSLDLQAEPMAVLVQQKTFESNEESRAEAHVATEVTQSHHLSHSQPQEAKTPQSGTAPQTFNLEPSPITQVVNASQEAPDRSNQLERSDPEKQVTEKTSPVEKLFSAASVNTGQPKQPRLSQTVEQEPAQHGWSSRPEHDHAPQALPKIPIRDVSWGCSNLSKFLAVKKLDSEPIIGLGAVWECRGLQQKTLYLCASCSERLFSPDICKHMISHKHQLNHMLKEYSRLTEFWKMNNLQPEIERNIFREVLIEVSKREHNLKEDAQCVPLPQDLFEYVKSAPFSEALKFLQEYKTNQKLGITCPPSSALQKQNQQPGEDQSQAGSQSTEMQPAQAPETDKTCDLVREEREEQHFDGITPRKVLSPSEETGVCSEKDFVAQAPEAGTCLSPQETSSNQSEHRPPTSQPITEFQVKQTELRPESPSFSPSSNDGPKISPASLVFTGDKSLLTRKRATDTSIETFDKSCTGDLQLKVPLPPKRICSSPQPSTKSTPELCSIPPAASATLLSAEDKNTEPGPQTWTPDITDLFGLVMERRSEKKMSPLKAAQQNSELSTSCATHPSVGVNLGPQIEQSSSEVPSKKKRWDLEPELDNSTYGTSLPPTTTVDSREQQNQGSVEVQSMCGKMDSFKANTFSEDIDHRRSEPQATTVPVNREVYPLPINAIVTPRLNHREQQFKANSNMQGYTAVNSQAAHHLSSAETVSHSNTQAASAGYEQTIQMSYTTNGNPYYLAPQNVGGFPTPYNPLMYAPSTYQSGGYITSRAHQSLGWMEVLQQQRFVQQQQLFQHQYMYPPSASAAAASTGTYGTYQGPSYPSSQQLSNIPQYEQVQHPNIPQQP